MDQRIHISEQLNQYWLRQDIKEKQKLMEKDQVQFRVWGASIFILAIAELYFEFIGSQLGVYMTKPFTMILIMLQVPAIGVGIANPYQKSILLGLMASVLGDVLLMVPQDYFLFGLGAFFLAHVLYIHAFWGDIKSNETPVSLREALPFLGFGFAAFLGIAFFGTLEPVMLVPVGGYALAIATMTWLAFARRKGLGNGRLQAANFAAAGAVLFMVSDLALALNRFVVSIEGASMFVMATYFSAQYLMARSAVVLPRKRF